MTGIEGPRVPSSGAILGAVEVPLAAKVAALRCPATYPEAPRGVEAIETHMSWVFLTERYAYKMKKPVCYDFLDFRTIEARRRNCEEEVRLNRRLAPDVYLGTVPLTREADGRLRLGGFREPVDWLVKMHRLPRADMLDHAIGTGTLSEAAVRALGFDLARFYRSLAPVPMDPAAYRARFAGQIGEHRRDLAAPAYGLDAGLVERICAAQLDFLERRAGLFDARVEQRRIVEAHGDLRPEHICLGPRLQIIDCLEFNREFRTVDPADELAFLAQECELLGAPWVGALVFEVYAQATDDAPPPGLVHFYKSYRACLRAKLAVWHLRDAEPREPQRWPALAARHLALAEKYVKGLR